MSQLDPRIEAVRKEYGLDASDFWQIPQNKQWVCKHSALELVAAKADVQWERTPQIIEADTANGIAVLSIAGTLGARTEWATGEASPKNNKNAYPWAMAEKRAKDRVILKLVGIHGLVYSEAEANAFEDQPAAPATLPKREARSVYERLSKANRALESTDEFNKFWATASVLDAAKSLPVDWKKNLRDEKADKAAELAEREALRSQDGPSEYVEPDFTSMEPAQ